jgi:hypothetical protein
MRIGMKMKWVCAVAVASAALAACNETTAPNAEGTQVLLEIEYVNYAWVPQYFGFYVDDAGDIYSYDRQGTPWQHGEDRTITEEQLNEKLSLRRTLLATRDSVEVAVVANRIAEVNTGQMSQPKAQCADAGALTYRAYKYNPGNRTYQPIVLRVEGDIAQQNTSQAAQQLVAYIRSLDLLEELLGCDP